MSGLAGFVRLLIRHKLDGLVIFAVIRRFIPGILTVGNPEIAANRWNRTAVFPGHCLDRDVPVLGGGVIIAPLALRVRAHVSVGHRPFMHFIFGVVILISILGFWFFGPG